MKASNNLYRVIDWMRYRYLYFAISLLVILPGLISILAFGFKLSIDFTGGTQWEVRFNQANVDEKKIRESLKPIFPVEEVIRTESGNFIIRTIPLTTNQIQQARTIMKKKIGDFEELKLETVGPILGKELLAKTIYAVILASSLILLYVTFRFKNKLFGLSAILAMIHDSLVVLGVFSLLGHFYGVEIDTLFVTAVLTILSFSVHDTIVVYDRIREASRIYPHLSLRALINKAVTETWVRSLNNSLTIIFMLLALVLLGGSTTRWFMVALLVGTISGTYSSTFTAAPLLYILSRGQRQEK